jgi:hypothetical protein
MILISLVIKISSMRQTHTHTEECGYDDTKRAYIFYETRKVD